MHRTRRRFLQWGAGFASVGLAGCSSLTGGSVSYPGGGGDGSDDGGSATTTSKPTSGATTQASETTQPPETTTSAPLDDVPNPSLGVDTDRVFSEIAWFATEYPSVVSKYRSRAGRAVRTATQVLRASELTEADVDSVLTVTEAFAAFAESEVHPHFYIRAETHASYRDYAQRFATFARRGDLDRAILELTRLRNFYERIGSESYANEWLSDSPIEDTIVPESTSTLLDYLRGGTEESLLYVVNYPSGAYSAYVFPEREAYETRRVRARRLVDNPDSVPVADAVERYDGVFDAVSVGRGRRGRAYVTSFWVPGAGTIYPSEIPYQPVYLQRYATPRDANAAIGEMRSGPVTVEEPAQKLGSHAWHRVYYYDDGDIVYAFLIQAGSYLVTAAPATTPWDERGTWVGPPWDEYPERESRLYNASKEPMTRWDARPDWDVPLQRSWLW